MPAVVLQSERSLRKEGSNRLQSLEAALQEAHNELKAERLLLQEVCTSCSLICHISTPTLASSKQHRQTSDGIDYYYLEH